MTYVTHKRFAVNFALLGVTALNLFGLSHINAYLALILSIPFAKLGGEFPDYDLDWDQVQEKTLGKWIINKLIYITGGRHRAWQTHSLDIAVLAFVGALVANNMLIKYEVFDIVDSEIMYTITISFMLGWLSHLFADMLTNRGIQVFCFWKQKIRLVPKKFLGVSMSAGGEWENFIYKFVSAVNIIFTIGAVAAPILSDTLMSGTLFSQ